MWADYALEINMIWCVPYTSRPMEGDCDCTSPFDIVLAHHAQWRATATRSRAHDVMQTPCTSRPMEGDCDGNAL
jgi:hypothetical protein